MEGMLALLIPIIALSIPIVAIWTKHQQKLAEMQIETTASASAEKAAQYATQIEALRDSRSVEDRDSGMPLTSGTREKV